MSVDLPPAAPNAREASAAEPVSITLPGIMLGVGLGGFVDGIVLHQLLQWHHMLSNSGNDRLGLQRYDPATVPGLQLNTVWDGIFHVTTWLAVLGGLAILYARASGSRRALWGSRALWGWILVGWGLFNLVEGVVNHHLLGIHHVRPGPNRLAWDLAFLALGAVLVAAGRLLQRGARRPTADGTPEVTRGSVG